MPTFCNRVKTTYIGRDQHLIQPAALLLPFVAMHGYSELAFATLVKSFVGLVEPLKNPVTPFGT